MITADFLVSMLIGYIFNVVYLTIFPEKYDYPYIRAKFIAVMVIVFTLASVMLESGFLVGVTLHYGIVVVPKLVKAAENG